MPEEIEQKPTEAQNQAEVQQPQIQFEDGVEETPTMDESAQAETSEPETEPEAQTEITESQKTEAAPTEKGQEAQNKPINQEAVQKKINKAIREKYEEQRRREEIEAKLAEAEKKLNSLSQETVIVPDMPDVFDPDFEQKVKIRDDALKRHAQAEAQKAIDQRIKEQAQKEKAQAEREKINGYVSQMYAAADSHGIKKEDLQAADNTVAMFVKDPGLASFIIAQKSAPLIVNHLAQNIAELEKISRMSPITAAAYIATDIIPAAERFKPKKSSAPEPLDLPSGKAGGKKSPYLEGVVFE